MKTCYTIGHSTRPIEEFIELLHTYHIKRLVDIRTIPKSLHNPQYGQAKLEGSLRHAGITYDYLPKLGGLRPSTPSEANNGWRNKSFRNYADYMQTDEFRDGIEQLMKIIDHDTAAIMCAEAVPWRCHRSLVGDALLVRGVSVLDIISQSLPKPHTLTPFARVEATHITYPKSDEDES